MIGRAAIGYPWIFNEIKHFFETGQHLASPQLEERLDVTRKHLDFSVAWKGEKQGILEMRRHYTNYFRKIHHFKPFRTKLVAANSHDEVHEILNQVGQKFGDFVLA